MPSTIPARLSFLFAALCVLYVLREAAPPRVFQRPRAVDKEVWIPRTLLAIGLCMAVLILVRFNPWNGALTMIVSFCALVVVVARGRMTPTSARLQGIAQHRVGMTFLAAFSWWGALQGFGPAIGIALQGPDMSTAPYLGDRPGPFAPYVYFFLIGWVPLLALAFYLVRRFRLARAGAVPLPGPASST